MALKGKREVHETLISKTCNVVAERGVILIADSTDGEVTLGGAVASGQLVAGLLLDDVESIDLTNRPENRHRNVVAVSGQVGMLLEGKVLTDKIKSGDTPAQFEAAYLAANGEISTDAAGAGELSIRVGTFLKPKDADGFAELLLEL